MTKIVYILGFLLILANSTTGLLISKYLIFNWLSVDIILFLNTLLLSKLSTDKISDGYKISLSFIYPVLCFISIGLALLSPDKFTDNFYVVGFIFILLIEVSLYLISKNIKSINSKK